MSGDQPVPETLSAGRGTDDPDRLTRRRRRWQVVGAAAVAAALTTLIVLQDTGGSQGTPRPTVTALPPEPIGAVVVLGPTQGRQARVDLSGPPAVVEIECIGPGSVLVRLNARSWVTQGCAPGELRRAQRSVTAASLDALDPGLSDHVLVSVSTVGTTEPSRWRVTVHPPVDAPA